MCDMHIIQIIDVIYTNNLCVMVGSNNRCCANDLNNDDRVWMLGRNKIARNRTQRKNISLPLLERSKSRKVFRSSLITVRSNVDNSPFLSLETPDVEDVRYAIQNVSYGRYLILYRDDTIRWCDKHKMEWNEDCRKSYWHICVDVMKDIYIIAKMLKMINNN